MPAKTNMDNNGTKYYRVTAKVGTKADGSPIRKQFLGANKTEALAKRDEYMQQLKNGLVVDFDKSIFTNAFKFWFEDIYRPAVSKSSYSRFETEYKKRISLCGLNNMRLVEIRTAHIQAFYNSLMDNCTASTIHSTHKVLAAFFKYADETDLIGKNPLKGIKLPAKEKKANVNAALIDDDIQKLKEAVLDDIGNFIFLFAVFSGLREGEILSLRYKDVDLKAGTISVNKSCKFLTVDGKYQLVEDVPKTETSIRIVPILPQMKPLLEKHIAVEREKHLRLGKPFNDESVLFSSSVGTHREAANVLKGLKKLFKRLDIKQATFHSLRHTFCTLLAKQEVPLKTASVLMGHSDISVTAKIYTHVDNAQRKKGIDRLSAYF